MASSKRKQDEKHLKMLREIVGLPHNKHCFDCHQRGPTYVNMTIGSFVCTSCSGILRGINPPHRVKSISMSSFTPEEMEFLKSRGNEFCRKVWLGLYDSRQHTEPDSKDENKIKEFMGQKYEKKRWYVAPTEAMHEEARKQNTPVKPPDQTKSKSIGNIPSLSINHHQSVNSKTLAAPPPINATGLKANSQPQPLSQPVPQSQNQQNVQKEQKASGFDLLGDLGNDPFASPAPGATAQTSTAVSVGGFADFNNFNSAPAPSTQPAFPPASSTGGLFQPLGAATNPPPPSSSGFLPPMSSAAPGAAVTTSISAPQNPGDRYAALADLDSVFSGGSLSSKPVHWDGTTGGPQAPIGGGSGGGGNVWGGAGGAAPMSMAPPTGNSMGAFGTSPANNTMATASWTADFDSVSTSSAPSGGNPFITTTAANPFGTTNTSTSNAVPNPFMGGQAPAGYGAQPGAAAYGQYGVAQTSVAGQFGQFGSATTPSSSAGIYPSASVGGFGQFGNAITTPTTAPQGQFGGMQNGGYGVPPQQPPQQQPQQQMGGWGQGQMNAFGGSGATYGQPPQPTQQGLPGGFGAAPNQFAKAQPQAYGGQPPQQFGGWGAQPAQPVANPFMSGAGPQSIPPRSSSTNPFL